MATRGGKSGQTGRKGRGKREGEGGSEPHDLVTDRRLLEQEMAAMGRLLSEQDFASIDDANAFLQRLLADSDGVLPRTEPSTALEKAQEVVYQALQTTGSRRAALARKALTVSPECADAYVLLAEAATDPEEARRLYEQGVAAGERALGLEMFTSEEGHFWGLLETRPYMRAREGLAHVLWHLDERAAAIEHAQELLRLNPNDNQGIRYVLAGWLLVVGDGESLEHLLAQYPDEWSAHWAYTRALYAFRRHGPGRQADKALKNALEVNPYVPLYLLGVKNFPRELPAAYGLGDESEAVAYIAEAAEPWLETAGTAEWMARVMLRLAAPALAAQSRAKARSSTNRYTWTRGGPSESEPSEPSESPPKPSAGSRRSRPSQRSRRAPPHIV